MKISQRVSELLNGHDLHILNDFTGFYMLTTLLSLEIDYNSFVPSRVFDK